MQKLAEINYKSAITGFVPTMGALHAGHVSLVKQSVNENNITIVSIFVNPKQFNDQNDYDNYPNTLEKDLEILSEAKCDIVFVPTAEDIFDNYSGHAMNFDGLDKIYEGEFRPGHFQGVVDIVYRLFDIIKPSNSYFGEKDFQQLAVIKLMVKKSDLKINIIPCVIIREKSGLAMSSRNERLNSTQRTTAAAISKVITNIKKTATVNSNPQELILQIFRDIDKFDDLKTEYAVFCEPDSLKSVNKFAYKSHVMLCVAVWCGKIRLIDNISLQF
jgi:pantoate--beta-alanine ligase